jgi:predicted DNA-binding protein (MmcQ/YjbR family)
MTTEKLTDYCMSLKGVKESIKWEDHLCYTIGEKIFCMTGMNDNSGVTLKVSTEDFEELTEREGIEQAPYFARGQWVGISKRNSLKPKEWEQYIESAYQLIKSKLTKKLQKEIDGE